MSFEQKQRTILTVRQFSQKHNAFPQAGLRHLIFNAGTNGFRMVIRKCGKKILLDEGCFFEWLDRQNNHFKEGAK